MTEEACHLAFAETKEQTNSRYWSFLRYGRVTASNLYAVAHSKIESGGVLKEMILGASTLKLTEAMSRGQNLEQSVVKIVEKKMNVQIDKVGIKLSPDLPEFGASPDGLTNEFVVEVKCPRNSKTFSNYVRNGCITPKFMAQVQLQMKMCGKSRALFCVAHTDFESSKEVTVLHINFDASLIDELISTARQYWENHIFPVLISAAHK